MLVPLHNPHTVPHVAQLCFSLLTKQKVKFSLYPMQLLTVVCQFSPPQHMVDQLFQFISEWLAVADPPTELLYTLPLLTPSFDIPKVYSNLYCTLFEICWQVLCSAVAAMAVDPSSHQDVRRAALHCLTTLCDRLYPTY